MAKKKSFANLREDAEALAKKNLPTHSLGLGVQVPDKLDVPDKHNEAGDKHQDKLPVHASDASPAAADHIEAGGMGEVKPEVDGQKIADKAGHPEQSAKSPGAPLSEEEIKEIEEQFTLCEAEEHCDDKEDEKKDEEDKEEMKEHLAALEASDFLPEEAKEKVKTIFEVAILEIANKKAAAEKARLSEHYKGVSKKVVGKLYENVISKMEKYLDWAVEAFMEDNSVPVEAGLANEVTESFVLKLRDLLKESFVEVPLEKRDLFKEQQAKIAELESALNEEMNKNVELTEQLAVEESAKSQQEIIQNLTEGMSVLDSEKLKKLIKNLSFEDADSYKEKVCTIKESYFPKTAKTTEDVSSKVVEDGGIAQPEASQPIDEIAAVAMSMSRFLRK